jgi:DNA-directed RNA polymerase specialized sigma24 family protein
MDDLLKVNEATDALSQKAPRLAKVLEMRYCGGYADPEFSQALNLNEKTGRRD